MCLSITTSINRFKELTIIKLYKTSFRLYRRNLKCIFSLMLLFDIPLFIIKELLIKLHFSETTMYLIDFCKGTIFLLSILTLIFIIDSNLKYEKITFINALKRAFKFWGYAIITNIIIVIFLVIIAIFLVLPALIAYFYFIFANHAIALKSEIGTSAIEYSLKLVKGRWWKVFFINLIWILALIALSKIEFILPDIILMKFIIEIMLIKGFVLYFKVVLQTLMFINFDYVDNKFYID